MRPAKVRSPEEGLRTTMELADAGIEMTRARLSRKHPTETEEQILARLNAWLRSHPVPGAPPEPVAR